MRINLYKVVREFKINEVVQKTGSEIFLSEREGENLVKSGFIVEGRMLDPNDKDDAKKIAEAEKRLEAQYSKKVEKEESRDEAKDEELKDEDITRKDLMKEINPLFKKLNDGLSEEDVQIELDKINSLTTPEMEKYLKKLQKKEEKLA